MILGTMEGTAVWARNSRIPLDQLWKKVVTPGGTTEAGIDYYNEHGFLDTPLNTLKICLEVERELLYRRINERTVAMVETGLPEETENLLAKGYSPDLKPMKSIGYRHMANYLRGEWSLEETIYTIQRDTRRYAKRQLTWFRADQEYVWIKPEDFDLILAKAKAFLFENA